MDQIVTLQTVCAKAYYTLYPFHENLSDEFRTNTCKYICDNPEVFKAIEIDPSEQIFEKVNKFITTISVDEFTQLFSEGGSVHRNYLQEKYNCMKETPTYYIVTRDKKNIKKFVEVVVANITL